MYKHILVATDGSKLSLKAVKTAARLAADLGARLSALYVVAEYAPPVYVDAGFYLPDATPAKYKEAGDAAAQLALTQVAKTAKDFDISPREIKVTSSQPWDAIVKTARTKKCDLIVMASHGRRGLAGFVLGSETTKVLTHSKIPVLVCR